MPSKTAQALMALSPLDGRYADKTAPLTEHFSEFALIRERVRVEILWLLFLSEQRGVPGCSPLPRARRRELERLAETFDVRQAERVKRLEARTRHDVKAAELFLAENLKRRGMTRWIPWLHFGCTSEDINSIAHARMIVGALRGPMRGHWSEVLRALKSLARRTAKMPMPARTHGQPASPTTMGKEINVFVHRLAPIIDRLDTLPMSVKMGGATGTFSAWEAACPEANWRRLTRQFLRKAAPDCEPLEVTTQIDPHDRLAEICLAMTQLCTVLIDLARDIWQYIGDGFIIQQRAKGQIGSSTMPHKVNPIDFENAEGNLGLASALLIHLATKLPISRLQRDLSDSTVMRSVGVAFGHVHLALANLLAGLVKIAPNPKAMREALQRHWEVLAEPIQTCLRSHGVADAYEQMRRATQGRALDESSHRDLVAALPLPEDVKARLAALRPDTYLGRAVELARLAPPRRRR
ncbi:adenylosuccinate lyase [Candidatus Sumerlaeota bacterium]|nr:adenylosuccinate lyase [Candidatus Sumerlaeota bacterium]